jgi:hypothetical protein
MLLVISGLVRNTELIATQEEGVLIRHKYMFREYDKRPFT